MDLRGDDHRRTASSPAPAATAFAADRRPRRTSTRIWGDTDVDTFHFGDATGVAGGTTVDSAGYLLLGSKTRAYGSQDLSRDRRADGEDRFNVYYLQTMNVAAGHSLTLDGQAETDYYTVYTTGSQGSPRNYVINVLDTGAEDDGVDELAIYGADSTFNGGADRRARSTRPTTSSCCAPRSASTSGAASCTGTAESRRPAGLRRAARRPRRHAGRQPRRPAPAATTSTATATRSSATSRARSVQRINYDTALNGRLIVYGLGGNDAFFTDDNERDHRRSTAAPATTASRSARSSARSATSPRAALAPQDVFPVLIATTRGWLSPGIHAPLVAQGGTGNDEFTVYSNQAELRLEGDDGNDIFVVRAFALAAVVDTDANGDGVLDLNDIEDPFGINPNASAASATTALDPNRPLDRAPAAQGQQRRRRLQRGRRAHDDRRDQWQDDVIPLDADRVARPDHRPRLLDRPAARHPRRRRRGRGLVQRQRAGLGRRRHRLRQGRRARHRVRRRHRDHGEGRHRRRRQRPLREHRGRRGRRARGRRRVLRPVDRVRRRLPRHRRPRQRHDQRHRRRRRGHRRQGARGRRAAPSTTSSPPATRSTTASSSTASTSTSRRRRAAT